MVRSYSSSLLKKAVLNTVPRDLFSTRSYTQTMLRLSPSEIDRFCLFAQCSLFFEAFSTGSDEFEKIRDNIVPKKLICDDGDTGKRTLIIDSEVQIENMRLLLSYTG